MKTRYLLILFIFSFFLIQVVKAGDDGYRYNLERMRCENKNRWGLNPDFFGECGNIENLDIKSLDFKNQTLIGIWARDIDFSSKDMSGVDISGGIFNRSQFVKTDLSKANLVFTRVPDANFQEAVLRGAVMQELHAFLTKFNSADMSDADLRGGHLGNSDFVQTNFSNSKLTNADFTSSDASGANFTNAKLHGVNFSHTNLKGANFENADLNRAAYDDCTKLPFFEWTAKRRGMVKLPRYGAPCHSWYGTGHNNKGK